MRLYALIPAGFLIASTALAQTAAPAPPAAAAAPPATAATAPAMAAPAAQATAPATAAQAPAATAPATAAAAAGATAPTAAAKVTHKAGGFKAKFEAANTTNDGKLTKDQAQAGHMGMVVKNFDAIDADHKGYVTLEDVKAFRAARAHKKPATDAAPAPSAN